MNTPHATAGERRFTVPPPLAGLLTRLLEGDPAHINREGASGAFRH